MERRRRDVIKIKKDQSESAVDLVVETLFAT